MSKIGTLNTGDAVKTQIVLPFLPMYVAWVAATQLKNVSVEPKGKQPLVNLDAAGLNTVGRVAQISQRTNATILRLSDGYVPDLSTTLTFENSADQTPDIYAWSESANGKMLFISIANSINANTPQEFERFSALFFPSMAATDKVTVTWRDGASDDLTVDELAIRLQLFQSLQNSASDYVINNYDARIRKVKYYPNSGAQTIYLQRLIAK